MREREREREMSQRDRIGGMERRSEREVGRQRQRGGR
jgi:hypothetical protein